MFRNRNWFGRNVLKPKNVHSLDHLKHLYAVLSKNQNVSENNRGLLVETLRSIAEILIWGDQNDSSVFDFFLEKNMLLFFLKILKQKCGSYVCVQLLQTLNILFENIRNETSLYYLLSNNHVNSIIVHKFDFSDEEVMAYYISFLKTLSLKLNCHTVHFFYNEHTNDFPLYTEAIKFFNHPESMVRIAVRTLTLNVYKVEDQSMLQFIRDRTAAPYFSNLVWFIGNHVLELDNCVHNDVTQVSGRTRLSDLVAEHLDHLHYLNDILCLNVDDLNVVLTEHLLNKLLIPLYIMSLLPSKNLSNFMNKEKQILISASLSLFLISQVFIIITEPQLIQPLTNILLKGCPAWCLLNENTNSSSSPRFVCKNPTKSEEMIENHSVNSSTSFLRNKTNVVNADANEELNQSFGCTTFSINITDEEKEQRLAKEIEIKSGSFLEAIFLNLRCRENDYSVLFSLCLLYAIHSNVGIQKSSLRIFLSSGKTDCKMKYNIPLIENLIQIISAGCQLGCRVRLVTLELAIELLKKLVLIDKRSILLDEHFAAIIDIKEQSTCLLRNFYKNEDIFLDMFEDEYYDIKKRPLKVAWLMMDSNLLLQPTNTPMTGVEFSKRLPCGEVERIRRAIRVFLLIRDLVLNLSGETETQLPLTDRNMCIAVETSLDLNNSDLITCIVFSKDGSKTRRFLAMDQNQLILVEPHSRLLGWGITRMAGFLQDIEVTGDKAESNCLHVTIRHTNTGSSFSAKFLFDDHIRCMAAKQKLGKGRSKAREEKMTQIAKLLDIPTANHVPVSARHQSPSCVLYGPGYKSSVSVCKTLANVGSSIKYQYVSDALNDPNKSIPSTSRASSPKLNQLSQVEAIQLVDIPTFATTPVTVNSCQNETKETIASENPSSTCPDGGGNPNELNTNDNTLGKVRTV